MANDWFDKYRFWLEANRGAEREQEKDSARKTLIDAFKNGAAYHPSALRNGVSQPIIATRSNTRKCRLTVMPEDIMCIGDLIYVFNEYWICMELYEDEFEITHGELWLCNQVFKYQDLNGKIIKKHAIIDDGSYSKGSDKAIPVTNNTFTCYVSMDEDSKTLCVDKRLAIDTIYETNGKSILDVGKICWVDTKSKNFGKGSHLLAFGLKDDLYSEERDNIDLMICDYLPVVPNEESIATLFIEGRETIRIGTGRSYKVSAIKENGEGTLEGFIPNWSLESSVDGVSFTANDDYSITLSVALDDALIGSILTLVCADESGTYPAVTKEIEVISIG